MLDMWQNGPLSVGLHHNWPKVCLWASCGAHVELGTRSYKSNEGLCTAKGNESAELTLDEVACAA